VAPQSWRILLFERCAGLIGSAILPRCSSYSVVTLQVASALSIDVPRSCFREQTQTHAREDGWQCFSFVYIWADVRSSRQNPHASCEASEQGLQLYQRSYFRCKFTCSLLSRSSKSQCHCQVFIHHSIDREGSLPIPSRLRKPLCKRGRVGTSFALSMSLTERQCRPGALPDAQNCPQKVKYGLYIEAVSDASLDSRRCGANRDTGDRDVLCLTSR
jgi:hypothetical protein